MVAAESPAPRLRPALELNQTFAVSMAVAMFIVNFVGFGPTFFLRPFFDVPQIPFYLYLHGAFGTAWFALVVAQAVLIANRNFARHRQLGWVGVGLVVVMLGLTAYAIADLVPRNVAAHPSPSEADIQRYSAVMTGDLPGLVIIPTLIALAIYFRRRPDIHMRLLLLATLEILVPASARIGNWGGGFAPAITVTMWSLIGAFVIHDLWTRRRIHLATVLGFAFFFAVNGASVAGGAGQAIVAYQLAHL